jgi:hypothetical protein
MKSLVKILALLSRHGMRLALNIAIILLILLNTSGALHHLQLIN